MFYNYKTLFLILILCLVPLAQGSQKDTLYLRGILLDTAFAEGTPISAEILENGDTATLFFGKPFIIPLPPESSWNLCLRNDRFEQCYFIEKIGENDSLIVDNLDNDNCLQVFTSFVEFQNDKNRDTSFIAPSADSAGIDNDLLVEENELLTRLRPVVIRVRKRPRRSLGQSTVTSKSIERRPGLAEPDVIKAIQALPGVVASSDFSSKIYVRGGGADQNLFLFDNGVVYSPVHFFGLFSTFLVDGIETVDFYKGGFAPRYGNRLSSVVDISTRKGGLENNDTLKLKGSAQITTFATTLSAEASRKGTRVQLSGRSTYLKEVLDGLKGIGLTDLSLDYRFLDLQGNVYQDFGNGHGVKASFYTGRDRLIFTPLRTDWGNLVIPINYRYVPSDDLDLLFTLSYSRFDQEFGIESLQSFSNIIESVALRGEINTRKIENHDFNAGFEAQLFKTTFGNKADFAGLSNLALDTFGIVSTFVNDRFSLGNFDLQPGVRLNYFSSLQRISAEPRLSVSYTLSDNQRLEAHAGYYEQFINSVIFGDFESVNEFYYPAGEEQTQRINPATSLLFSVGYSIQELLGMFSFTWEAYYKTLNNLIIFDPASKPDSIRTNPRVSLGDLFIPGEGYSLGTELSLQKSTGAITGGVSYSFGYSVQKELDQVFYAKWDIPHSVKADLGIGWFGPQEQGIWRSKRTVLRSSVQVKYVTGLPYTEITGYLPTHYRDQGEGDNAGGPTPDFTANTATPISGRNGSRYPAYSRIDIKVIDWEKENKWNFSWTFLNIFDRENIFIYTYDNTVTPPERNSITQFPFFPILLSYKRYF